MTRTEWLDARRQGIGASDAAAVCGVSPWATPLHVYLDKVGELPHTPEPTDGPLYWGLRLEDVLAEEYERRTGRTVRKPVDGFLDRLSLGWQRATPDRIVMDDGRLLQLKTSLHGKDFGEQGTDEIPEYYALQVTHEMIVTGADTADLAVLIGGNDFRIYTVHFSDALATALTRIERDFWDRVERRDPPPPDWSHPETPRLVELLHRDADGVNVDLGDDAHALAREYRDLGPVIAAYQARRDLVKQQLFEMIGAPGVGRLPGGLGEVEWKRITVRKAASEARTEFQNRLVPRLED